RSAIRRVFYRLLLLLNLEVLHRFGKLTDLLGKVTRGAQQLVPDLRAVGHVNADRLATDLRAELFQIRNGDALHVLQDVASHQLQHDVLQQLVRRLVVLIKQSAVGLRLGLESLAEVWVVQTRDAHFSATADRLPNAFDLSNFVGEETGENHLTILSITVSTLHKRPTYH